MIELGVSLYKATGFIQIKAAITELYLDIKSVNL